MNKVPFDSQCAIREFRCPFLVVTTTGGTWMCTCLDQQHSEFGRDYLPTIEKLSSGCRYKEEAKNERK